MLIAMPKNTKRGRPPGRQPTVALQTRVPPELGEALEAFCDAQRIKPDKSEVLRTIVQEFLEREGFWPLKKPE